MAAEGTTYWPLDSLEISVQEMRLRPVTEADLDELADLLPLGMEMNPATPRPFGAGEKAARGTALRQEHWKSLGSWTPTSWDVGFLVSLRGQVVGVQSLEGEDYSVLRTVETASWLGTEFRGRGLGKLMRVAVLSLAFDGLGAEVALTEAWSDNAASLGVSRSLGYRPNGSARHRRGGHAAEMPRWRLDLADWRAVDRPHVAITGLDACRAWFLGPRAAEARPATA